MKKPEYVSVVGCVAAPEISTAGILACTSSAAIATACSILMLAA
ncbi:hypothetical protein ACFLKB_17785 (plasmid) [Clostridium sp. FAM 1755]|nr:hypothetical protein [Clostridium sporogenes]